MPRYQQSAVLSPALMVLLEVFVGELVAKRTKGPEQQWKETGWKEWGLGGVGLILNLGLGCWSCFEPWTRQLTLAPRISQFSVEGAIAHIFEVGSVVSNAS